MIVIETIRQCEQYLTPPAWKLTGNFWIFFWKVVSIKFRFDLWISYLKIFCWAFLTNQEASWPFQRSCHLLLPKVTTRWRFLAKFSVRGTKSPVTINRPRPNPFSLRIEYFLQNFFAHPAQIWRFCSFSIIASFRYHSKKTAKI